MACGGYHSAVVTDAGRVFSWGFNRYGQCGNGSKENTVPEPSLVDLSAVPPGGMGEGPRCVPKVRFLRQGVGWGGWGRGGGVGGGEGRVGGWLGEEGWWW